MTVTYSSKVATVRWWTFIRILFRWRGSIYKLVLPDLLVFIGLYTIFSLVYRLGLPPESRKWFELFCIYCSNFENLIPIAFILGFFVQLVASRWWEQFLTLPFCDNVAMLLNAYVDGDEESMEPKDHSTEEGEPAPDREVPSTSQARTEVDSGSGGLAEGGTGDQQATPSRAEQARLLRRTVMRYVNLSFAAAFRRVSYPIKKRIPKEEDFVRLNLMTKEELELWNSCPIENKFFLPLTWSTELISNATKDGFVKDLLHEEALRQEIDALRGKLGTIFSYDYINPPLAYTQAATIAVYSFFLATLFGRQFLDPSKGYEHTKFDFYVPIFTILQFTFYVGWLKVAEELINPFGMDDDDFDMVKHLRRNLQVSALMTDPKLLRAPTLMTDIRWDTTDFNLPESAKSHRRGPHTGSATHLSDEPSQLSKFLRVVNRQESNLSTPSGRSIFSRSRDNVPAADNVELGGLSSQMSTTSAPVTAQPRQPETVTVDETPLISITGRSVSENAGDRPHEFKDSNL